MRTQIVLVYFLIILIVITIIFLVFFYISFLNKRLKILENKILYMDTKMLYYDLMIAKFLYKYPANPIQIFDIEIDNLFTGEQRKYLETHLKELNELIIRWKGANKIIGMI